MLYLKLISFAFLGILWILQIDRCASLRNWDIEIVSIDANSSNENKFNISCWTARKSRSEITLSCVVDWKFDADKTTMVEGLSFNSFSGHEKDYKLLPYGISKMRMFDFLNSYYNEIVYKNVAECSNFPDYRNGFKPPFPQSTYKLNECSLTGDGFPEILPSGYYKLVLKYSGQVDVNVIFTIKILSKNLLNI